MNNDYNKIIVNDTGICQRIYVEGNIFTNRVVIPKEAYNRYIKESENNDT